VLRHSARTCLRPSRLFQSGGFIRLRRDYGGFRAALGEPVPKSRWAANINFYRRLNEGLADVSTPTGAGSSRLIDLLEAADTAKGSPKGIRACPLLYLNPSLRGEPACQTPLGDLTLACQEGGIRVFYDGKAIHTTGVVGHVAPSSHSISRKPRANLASALPNTVR
jgi:hypothetical protein